MPQQTPDEDPQEVLSYLAKQVESQLRASGHGDIKVNLPEMTVSAAVGDKTQVVYLGNLLDRFLKAKDEHKQQVLKRFLAGMADSSAVPDIDWTSAQKSLVSVLRSRAKLDLMRLQQLAHLKSMGKEAQADISAMLPPSRPFSEELATTVVIDRPDTMALVSPHLFEHWDRSFSQCWDQGQANLRTMSFELKWAEISGLKFSAWHDAYDAARLLLPEVIAQTGFAHPVAVAPFSGTLMVAEGRNPQAVALMGKLIKERLSKEDDWLSFELFELQGDQLKPATAPELARSTFKELRIFKRARDYDNQRGLLQSSGLAQGLPYVAKFEGSIEKETQKVTSYCVWPNTQASYLPEAEHIAFMRMSRSGPEVLMVPWEVAKAHVPGQLRQVPEFFPPRFETQGFLSDEAWRDLQPRYGLPNPTSAPNRS